MTRNSISAALRALRVYTSSKGETEQAVDSRDTHAADLITDLLLTFSAEEAAAILVRAERASEEERSA